MGCALGVVHAYALGDKFGGARDDEPVASVNGMGIRLMGLLEHLDVYLGMRSRVLSDALNAAHRAMDPASTSGTYWQAHRATYQEKGEATYFASNSAARMGARLVDGWCE